MAVNVKVNYQTEEADAQIAKTQAAIAANYEKLGEAAQEALQLEKVKGAFEGMKDAAEVLGPAIGDADGKLAKFLDNTLKLAEGGAKVGSIFGPVGALVGGLVGGVAAVFAEALNAEKELEERAKAAAEEVKKQEQAMLDMKLAAIDATYETLLMVEALDRLDRTSLSGLSGALQNTQDQIRETIKVIAEGSGATLEMIERLHLLQAAQAGDVAEARGALLDSIEGSANKITDTLDRSKMTLKELKDQADGAKTKLEGFQSSLGKIYDGIGDINDKTKADAAIQSYTDLEIKIAKYTDQYNAAQTEIEARAKEGSDKRKDIAKHEADDLAALQKAVADSHTDYLRQRYEAEAKLAEDVLDLQARVAASQAESDRARLEVRNAQLRAEADASYAAFMQKKEDYKAQVEEIQAQLQPLADVFSQSFDLIAENLSKGQRPLQGYASALRSFISDVLSAYARKWGLQSIAELAEGFATLGLPIPGARVAAMAHFQAAGLFGAAAVAAGAGALAIGRNTQAPAPASSGASSGGGGSNPSLGRNDRGASSSQGGTIIVYMGGAPGSTTLYANGSDDRAMAPVAHKLSSILQSGQRDLRLDMGRP